MDRDPIDPDRLVERRARRRVDMKLGFFIHALVFVLVNAGLFALTLDAPSLVLDSWPRWAKPPT